VIVGGELSAAGETLTEAIAESIDRYAIPSAAEDVTVVPGVLGERAELLGALALVLHGSDRFAAPGDGARARDSATRGGGVAA
jgi:hypothetical protein